MLVRTLLMSMELSITAVAEIRGGPREQSGHYTCLLQRLIVDCWFLPMDVFDLEKTVEWWGRPGWRRLRRGTG